MVADSALYSADALKTLGSLSWITRVPLTLKEAQQAVTEVPESAFKASQQWEGYDFASVCSTYGGVEQRWVIVRSDARRRSDEQRLHQQLHKHQKGAQQQLRRQQQVDFECAEDAKLQLQRLARPWKYHTLKDVQVDAHPHYDRGGRPKADCAPSRIIYRARGILEEDPNKVDIERRKAGKFILATNQLQEDSASPDKILGDYKGQQSCERGFRLLKDPLFFCSSVFLKKPQRIAALAMVMGVSLMVYSLAQRQIRQALERTGASVPDQRRKDTQTPTMRWIFQCLQNIQVVWIEGKKDIANLTPQRKHILQFFGAQCQKYYLTG